MFKDNYREYEINHYKDRYLVFNSLLRFIMDKENKEKLISEIGGSGFDSIINELIGINEKSYSILKGV